MTPHPVRPLLLALGLSLGWAWPAAAQTPDLPFTAAEIEAAQYDGSDLPRGRSALTAKVQLLLDRSGTSPGVIDGFKGGMSQSAIKAFERRTGLPQDGVMDPHVWNLLQSFATRPVTQTYVVTAEDAAGLAASIPTDYAEKALMPAMAHTSVAERLGERFHMDEKFIEFLNPGVALVPGATIQVMAPNPRLRGQVTRIIIDKDNRRVAGYNARGQMVVDYPATIGSSATPSPQGRTTCGPWRSTRTIPTIQRQFPPGRQRQSAGHPAGAERAGGHRLDRADQAHLRHPRHAHPVAAVREPVDGLRAPDQLGCRGAGRHGHHRRHRGPVLDAGVTIADVTGSGTAVSPPVADIALPEGTTDQITTPDPAQPLSLPDPQAPATVAPTTPTTPTPTAPTPVAPRPRIRRPSPPRRMPPRP